MNFKTLSNAAAVALAAFSLSCAPAGAPSQKAQAASVEQTVAVKLVAVQPSPKRTQLTVSGLLASEQEARLSFKTGGIVACIFVREGDRVVEGQILAKLNLTEIDAQVEQAQEGLDKSKRDLDRTQKLFDASVATREQLENAKTAFNVSKHALEIAQYNRAYSEIRAPGHGAIVRKLVTEGELAGPGTPVLVFAGSGVSAWVLRCGVSDRNWARLAVGDRATTSFDAYPGQSFDAQIVRLSQGADPASGLYQVELRVVPGKKAFATGLFGKATIQIPGDENSVAIPVDSLVEGQGDEAKVFTIESGRAQEHAVRVLELKGDTAYVTSNLKVGRKVVSDGAAWLAAGTHASPVE